MHHIVLSTVDKADVDERHLDPAVYFDPLGRYGMAQFADVLLDMVEANR